jgi:hypothetical protein
LRGAGKALQGLAKPFYLLFYLVSTISGDDPTTSFPATGSADRRKLVDLLRRIGG